MLWLDPGVGEDEMVSVVVVVVVVVACSAVTASVLNAARVHEG
jgi:hypothetical protein